jgi:hypothetical protein
MSFIRRCLRQTPVAVGAVVAVIGATAGMALASRHSHDLTIHACYAKRGGALRIAVGGKCRRSEAAISWNQVGQAGAAGRAGANGSSGATGQTGPMGPSGPSDVYVNNIGTIDPLGTDPFSVSGSLTVPAGSYVVSGRANFYNSGSNSGPRPTCSINAGADIFHGHQLDYETDELGANSVGSFHIFGGVSLTGTYTFTSQGTLLMNCHQVGADANVSANSVTLIAEKVGSLTVTP